MDRAIGSETTAMGAIGELFVEHRRSLRALARHLLRDDAAADDAVQDAATIALTRAPDELRDGAAWLSTIVRRLAFRRTRDEQRRTRREAVAATPELVDTSDTVDALARAETLRLLANAVAELAEPYRRTIVLRFFEELPVATIAAREGAPEPTIRTRLHRALEQLRLRLDEKVAGGRAEWNRCFAHLTTMGVASSSLGLKLAVAALLLGAGSLAWVWRASPVAPTSAPTGAAVIAVLGAPPAPPQGAPSSVASALAALAPTAAAATDDELTTLHGRVLDESGAPLAGAHVMVGEVAVVNGQPAFRVLPLLECDADGRYAASGLAVGATLTLAAGLPGRCGAESSTPITVAVGAMLPDLVVTRGVELAGIVVTADGAPVAGAQLLASSRLCGGLLLPELPPPEFPAVAVGLLQSTNSSADGAFRLTGLAPRDTRATSRGGIGVVVQHASFATGAFDLSAGDGARLVIGPPPKGRIVVQGNLVGAPEPIVTLDAFAPWVTPDQRSLLPAQGRRLVATRVAAAGSTAPPEWSFTSADAPLLLRAHVEVADRPIVEHFVELAPGDDATIELSIPGSASIEGCVVAADTGLPVGGADVLLLSGEGVIAPYFSDARPQARTKSDADGRFTLPATGTWATVRVIHPEFSPLQPRSIEVAKQAEPLVVALRRGGRVVARMVGGDRSSRARLRFFLHSRALDPAPGETLRMAELDYASGPGVRTDRAADRDGAAAFDWMPPGDYLLQALGPPDSLTREPKVVELEVREGTETIVEWHLLDDGEMARLTGSARVDGEPVRGGSLTLVAPPPLDELSASNELDDEGFFDVVVPAGRPLQLSISSGGNGGFAHRVGVLTPFTAGEERSLDLELATGALRGRVVDQESGRPIAGAQVRLVGWPGLTIDAAGAALLAAPIVANVPSLQWPDHPPCESDADGRFTTRVVEPGRWQLLVAATGYAPQQIERAFVDAVPGEATVALRRTARELVIAAASPPADPANPNAQRWCITVAARDESTGALGQPFAPRVSESATSIVVGDLPDGAFEVVVAPDSWPSSGELPLPAAARYSIGAGEDGRIERTLAAVPAGALLLGLANAEGRTELGARVELFDMHGAALPAIGHAGRWVDGVVPWSRFVSHGGRYAFRALPAGPVRVVITSMDGARREVSGEVVAGRVVELESAR